MRVVHLVNHCDRGGNVHVAVDLACLQARNGHDVIYASGGGRFELLLAKNGVRHEHLSQNLRNPVRACSSLAQVFRLCRWFGPEILHAHMMSGAVHGYIASRVLNIPLVTTVHNSFDRHSFIMRLGDHVVAVSKAERDLLLRRGYRGDRLHVVANGTVGTPRDSVAAYDPVNPQRPCITTLCGLEQRKGVHDIIEAFRIVALQFPNWSFYIAGEGPERTVLEEQVRSSGLTGRVFFLGFTENAAAILENADVFVLASHSEPFGLSIVEARRAGCAVIGTRVGGITEQLEFGSAGRLVEPGKPLELAAELTLLMADPNALAQARKRARENLDYFDVRRVYEDYALVYAHALCRSHI